MRGYSQQNNEEPILHDTQLQKDIDSLRSKTKWIDIEQFLEKRRFYSLKKLRIVLYTSFFLSIVFVAVLFYYKFSQHTMYSIRDDEQLMHVNGLEYTLLNFDFISIPWDNSSRYHLREKSGFVMIFCLCSFIFSLIVSLVDSSIIKCIYNIQDGDKKMRFRIVEDTKGRKGICNAGRLRIRQLLPFEYDEIFATYDNSYVCKKDGKYGVYNTDLKKMAIPVIYDDIYSISPESIVLIKDEQKHCLTHKGYRVVK